MNVLFFYCILYLFFVSKVHQRFSGKGVAPQLFTKSLNLERGERLKKLKIKKIEEIKEVLIFSSLLSFNFKMYY